MSKKIFFQYLSLLSFILATNPISASHQIQPDTLVVKVSVDTSGNERILGVTPLRMETQIENESDATAAVELAEAESRRDLESCQAKKAQQVAEYRRIARRPDIADIHKIEFDVLATCDLPCAVKKTEAIRFYRSRFRQPDSQQISKAAEKICTDVTIDGASWLFQDRNVSSRVKKACFNCGLGFYYPGLSTGTHRNMSVPLFTYTYNGMGNPFDFSGYVLYRTGFWYYFYRNRFFGFP